MLVTVTGTFNNAGDYLIGDRARRLLSKHVDQEIVNINRKQINEESYELFNRARAVLLTGGPAYQRKIYPDIFPIDLNRINRPVMPFGLGWKGNVQADPRSFAFTDESVGFIRELHADTTKSSSARDFLTVDLLNQIGVKNVLMTGCPAWYDEDFLQQDFKLPNRIKTVALSVPAFPSSLFRELLPRIARRFPLAKRYLTYQAGFESSHKQNTAEYTKWNRQTALLGRALGYQPVSFAADFVGFESLMSKLDFHVGFRVHSHIFCVSRRIPSLLIAEDSRAVGQMQAMSVQPIDHNANVSQVMERVDQIRTGVSDELQVAVESIRRRYPVMLEFLSQL